MTTPSPKQLREFITTYFNDSELNQLCADYFPEVYDDFTIGMLKPDKVLHLLGYCRRRELTANLLGSLEEERKGAYQKIFAAYRKTAVSPTPPKTQPRNPKQIFISYATKEAAELAERLAADCRASGYPVWIAPTSIQPGEKWAEAIERGLQKSGIFVLLLTPAAVDSYWVKTETDVAMMLEGRGKMRLLLLDVLPCSMPLRWEVRQFIPFRDQYERGLTRLQWALEDSPAKQTAPAPRQLVQQPPQPPPKQKPNSFIHEKTGMEFVRIPAGEFKYGDNLEVRNLPEYWISKTAVTQAVYKRFIDANPSHRVPNLHWDEKKRIFKSELAQHPVVRVSWHDAIAFCKWAGLQLPTEEEWEKAARGTDGRKYPWGNNDPTDELCNFNNNVKSTTPVGQYSPQGDSSYDCVDMSGNVWEWCLNKYETPTDAMIDDSGARRSLRGGAFNFYLSFTRAAFRYYDYPVLRYNYVGFRVAEHLSDSDF